MTPTTPMMPPEYKQQMESIAAEFLDRQYDPIINDRMNKKEELLP